VTTVLSLPFPTDPERAPALDRALSRRRRAESTSLQAALTARLGPYHVRTEKDGRRWYWWVQGGFWYLETSLGAWQGSVESQYAEAVLLRRLGVPPYEPALGEYAVASCGEVATIAVLLRQRASNPTAAAPCGWVCDTDLGAAVAATGLCTPDEWAVLGFRRALTSRLILCGLATAAQNGTAAYRLSFRDASWLDVAEEIVVWATETRLTGRWAKLTAE
jgi:hypothetical protein